MRISRHEPLKCRICGQDLDSAADPESNQVPFDGAVSICMGCGEVSIYVIGAFGVALREPTMQEMAEVAANPQFQQMREILNRFNAVHRPVPPSPDE